MKPILFRCSSLGKLATEPREKDPAIALKEKQEMYSKVRAEYAEKKNKETKVAKDLLRRIEKYEIEIVEYTKLSSIPHLSASAKEECIKAYAYNTYGITEDVETLAMKKGTMTEEQGFDLLALRLGIWVQKNTERKNNGIITGEIDAEYENIVIDNKSSSNYISFLKNRIQNLKDIYWWQGQGYCELWDKDKALFSFTLNNTPETILNDLKKRLAWRMGCIDEYTDPLYLEAVAQLERNNIFDDMPNDKRVIMVEIERDRQRMEWMQEVRIPQCRRFIELVIDAPFDVINYTKK